MQFQQKLVIVAQDRSRLSEISEMLNQVFPGAQIFQTWSGEFALESLRCADVDILITAGGSIEMSAFTLIQRAKMMDPSLPVLAVGYGCDQFRAFAAGANGFVHFDQNEDLVEVISRYIPAQVAFAA